MSKQDVSTSLVTTPGDPLLCASSDAHIMVKLPMMNNWACAITSEYTPLYYYICNNNSISVLTVCTLNLFMLDTCFFFTNYMLPLRHKIPVVPSRCGMTYEALLSHRNFHVINTVNCNVRNMLRLNWTTLLFFFQYLVCLPLS